MFTGIVQGIGIVLSITKKKDFHTISIKLPAELTNNPLVIGGSIAVNGCCLTITSFNKNGIVTFDIIKETLFVTNLDELQKNSLVNLERASCVGEEVGGHLLSGHILVTAKIINYKKTENNLKIRVSLPSIAAPYILYKGYIAIDGISLTVSCVDKNSFEVNLIPETLKRTTLLEKLETKIVNIEVEHTTQVIVDTVERIMNSKYNSFAKYK